MNTKKVHGQFEKQTWSGIKFDIDLPGNIQAYLTGMHWNTPLWSILTQPYQVTLTAINLAVCRDHTAQPSTEADNGVPSGHSHVNVGKKSVTVNESLSFVNSRGYFSYILTIDTP